jgi:hypothetical protein
MVPAVPQQASGPERPFRPISASAYKDLDPGTRDRIVRARHIGIIQSSEKTIHGLLMDALTQSRQLPDGTFREPYRHDELVMVLIHREDPVFPEELRPTLENQDLEVGIFPVYREQFAQHLLTFEAPDPAREGKTIRPYRRAGKVLTQPPPNMTIYFAVFDTGMCTVTFMGFDPAAQGDTVPMDPGTPAPPSIDPMPKGDIVDRPPSP